MVLLLFFFYLEPFKGTRIIYGMTHIRLFFFFCLFRAKPKAYGGSQARGLIEAIAASLYHSNAGSKPHLRPTPHLRATLDP